MGSEDHESILARRSARRTDTKTMNIGPLNMVPITLGVPITLSTMTWADWTVVAGYLLVLLVSGLWFAQREPSGSEEYFLGGRRMPVWAVAFSVVASSLSIATFIGVPQLAYDGNLTYLSTNIGGLIAVFIVAGVFIPAFYKYQVTSIYELLERRFGPGAKVAASGGFMVGRVFASGARVYIGAIPLAMILFGEAASSEPRNLIGAIAVLSVVAVAYTLVGGIASVIWTDVLQTLVLVGSVLACVIILWSRIEAPTADVIAALSDQGKLVVMKSGLNFDPAKGGLIDFSASFTLLTAVLGFSLLNLAAYGADHDMVQRMLTCKNAAAGGRSAIVAIFISIPIVALFLLVGLLLHVYYRMPNMMGAGAPMAAPDQSLKVFSTFMLTQLPSGLTGLMVAGLFACGLGSLNSAINAMAATLIKDFYMPARPNQPDSHYLAASRWAVAGWGVALAGFAVLCIYWQRANPATGLIDLALSVMTFAHSGLVAVFLAALLTKRGTTASVIAALVTGFVVALAFQPMTLSAITWILDGGPAWAAGIRSWASTAKFSLGWIMLFATTAAFLVCIVPANTRVTVGGVVAVPADKDR